MKVHGSELEYAMRGRPDLATWGGESLAGAAATLVGSSHVAEALTGICGPVPRTHVVPPGVDVDFWRPMPRRRALAALLAAAAADEPNPDNVDERRPDDANAERLAAFLADDGPLVVYFGKLIPQKGVDVLLAALAGVDARVVVAGFGPQRTELEALARARGVRALFTGPLEHRHLAPLLALADVCAVPSVFPEAFGMVAAEAAAAGCPPLVADHSGLAEVGSALAAAYPPGLGHLATSPGGDVGALHDRLVRLLSLPADERTALRSAARRTAVERWSWAGVAARILRVSGVS